MKIFGPKWPLKRGSEDTYETYHNLKDQVNFYLKNLILTSPGENISAPLTKTGTYSKFGPIPEELAGTNT